MMDPPSDPSQQPGSSSQGAGEDARSHREVDLWCAISESPSLVNAPAPDVVANLWQVEAAAVAAEELEAAAAGAGGLVLPWCTDDEHDHVPSSSVGVPRFPADSPNLCSMRDVDFGAPGYRFGMLPNQALGRQESLELLAESWAQLAPDELVERFTQDDLRHFQNELEQFLLDDSVPGLQPIDPPGGALNTPETPNEESTETVSSSGLSICDTPDEGAVATSSCDSQGASAAPSPGSLKRKVPVLDPGVDAGAAGASPPTPTALQQQHQQSMDTLQKKLKVPVVERPSLPRTNRTRYEIQTRTEVDVIEDGYRWRKYGQKPVKNSAHPRNYYRCTTVDCPVRKRVERSTEDPRHVLTTYDGIHNHPETASTGGTHARDAINLPGNSGSTHADPDVPVPALQQPAPLGPMPPRLPPSNYITPSIISHLLAVGNQVPPDQARRWSHPPQAAGTIFQRNIELLQAHQLFRLRYGTQYPLLANMLNLMRGYSPARPPMMNPRMDPRLDPRMASLLAAQSYNNPMRLSGQIHQDPILGSAGPVMDPQQQQAQQQPGNNQLAPPSGASLGTSSSSAGPSVGPSNLGYVSIAQRLLWQQGLMGERFGSETGHPSQQPASDNSGAAENEGPENHPDVRDPPA